jgi:hypothetical protein
MPRLIQLCSITLVYMLSSITAYALDFKEGEWELTVKQGVKGMPSGMGAMTWRECLTQSRPIPTVYLQARSCDVLDQHVVYRTLRYKLSCYTEHGSLTNEGKIHFGGLKFTGDSKSDVGDVAGKNILVRYKFEGRRIGDCH